MIATDWPGSMPSSCSPAPTRRASSSSRAYVHAVARSSPSSSVMWVRSGWRSACHSSTATSVVAASGVAISPAATSATTSVARAVAPCARPAARRTALTRSRGVRASVSVASGSRTPSACSMRSPSSTPVRLSMPRSRSSWLSSVGATGARPAGADSATSAPMISSRRRASASASGAGSGDGSGGAAVDCMRGACCEALLSYDAFEKPPRPWIRSASSSRRPNARPG